MGRPAFSHASLLTALIVAASAALSGQQAPNQTPQTFEIASAKPNTSGDWLSSMHMTLPDGFNATNQPLPSLVSLAYTMPLSRIPGGPDWFTSAPFDINAKVDHRITFDEKLQMIRVLLEERSDALSDRPSGFTLLQEQLGLKLESTRAVVDVLVIDRVERPTPD